MLEALSAWEPSLILSNKNDSIYNQYSSGLCVKHVQLELNVFLRPET